MKRQSPAAKSSLAVQRAEKLSFGTCAAGLPVPQSLAISVSQRVSTGAPARSRLAKYSAVNSPGWQLVGGGGAWPRPSAPRVAVAVAPPSSVTRRPTVTGPAAE